MSKAIETLHVPLPIRLLQGVDFPRKLGIMDRIFGAWLASKGIVWVDTAAGLPWKLDLAHGNGRWIVYGKYEGGHFLDWAKRALSPSAVVVDAGANIGQMLLYLAQCVPDGRVLAFEPGSQQRAWLKECLERNPHLPVELLPVGLGERSVRAYLFDDAPSFVHGARSQVSETHGEDIQLVRLSDVLHERNIEHVDLWKLDVEGSEIDALRGADEFLRSHRIHALYVELAGENGPRVRTVLASYGYECLLFNARGALVRPDVLPPHTNGLFLPLKVRL